MRASSKQIPIFLLTGFLGAGKTTLLNRILQDPAMQDSAIVMNEFGLVSIDHDLVREGRERPMVTTTGCICCTIGSDLRTSLHELLDERTKGNVPSFSRVIVETTGLADPAPIINSLIPGGIEAKSIPDHWVARAFCLSAVITVIDPDMIAAALEKQPESLRQIAFADHLIVNCDEAGIKDSLFTLLQTINPAARIHNGNEASFRPLTLLEPGSYSAFGKGEDLMIWLQAEQSHHQDDDHADGDAHDHHHHHHHDHSPHHHSDHDRSRHGDILAVPLTRKKPLDPEALMDFLTRLTNDPAFGLLRIKGLVTLIGDDEAVSVVHAVQHRLYPMIRLASRPEGLRENRLIVIGTKLDAERLQADFDNLA